MIPRLLSYSEDEEGVVGGDRNEKVDGAVVVDENEEGDNNKLGDEERQLVGEDGCSDIGVGD